MAYQILLLIGALGFLAQLILGFTHGGGHVRGGAASNTHGHAGTGNNLHHAGHQAPVTHHAAPAHQTHANTAKAPGLKVGKTGREGGKESSEFSWMALLSPLALFSIALGAGATGMLLKALLSPVPLALAAAVGGFAFYGLIVQPLMRFILRFASEPAKNLGGVVAQEVEVMGRFDEAGRGMVCAEVDGQMVRLLAYLDPDIRKDGMTVIPGERLVVTQVDPQKNTVRVTRL